MKRQIIVKFLLILSIYLILLISCKKLPYLPKQDSVIYISAHPQSINIGESSNIRIIGVKGNGYPLPDGTVVYLFVSSGYIENEVYLRKGNGKALFKPVEGFSGSVKITAKSGMATISPSELVINVTEKQVKYIYIDAIPSRLAYGGGSSKITIRVLDEKMEPVAGIKVFVSSDSGLLSRSGLLTTDLNGKIKTTLSTKVSTKVFAEYKNIKSEKDIIVDDRGDSPTADFIYSPKNPKSGETVYFNATSSSDSDGYIIAYEWDFGDGSSSKGRKVSHVYEVKETKTFFVVLKVTDNNGLTDTKTEEIEVGNE